MAWRDSRQSRRRLLLFVSSMILGVAALVAIGSFRENLQDAVDGQAKSLLGADLTMWRNLAFTPEMEALVDSVGGEQTRELQFTSMIYFPASGGTRLGQVRALDGRFPFYGDMETLPPDANATYQTSGQALIDKNAATQFEVAAGDSVKVGNVTYEIAGVIENIPGENSFGC